MDYTLLDELIRTPGISGREEKVRNLMAGQMNRLGATIAIDAMGNLIGHLPGKGPRVALMAHMDEVGFMVSRIEPEGFIRVMPVGGVDPRVFGAQKVLVHGREDLPGIVGSIPPHLLKNKDGANGKAALPVEESFIDTGLPFEQVDALVRVGDPVTFAVDGWENDTAFFGKALDDRLGLFVMLSAVQQAANIDCDLFLLATTQEEYGLRGAGPAVFGVTPQIALALEGTVASDTPGIRLPANTAPTAQGGGPEIRLSDRRMLADRALADFIVATARAAGLAHQVVVKNTGATDAAAAQITGGGFRAGALAVPVRYIHAPIGLANKADIDQTIRLTTAFLEQVSSFAG